MHAETDRKLLRASDGCRAAATHDPCRSLFVQRSVAMGPSAAGEEGA
jgi:hypothetical protein